VLERQRDSEAGSCVLAVDDLDPSVMLVHDLLHEGQSEPHPVVPSRIEHVEEAPSLCIVDPAPFVGDLDERAT
jgi:hypothetical protein